MEFTDISALEVQGLEKQISEASLALGTTLFELVKDQYLGGAVADFIYDHELFTCLSELTRAMAELQGLARLHTAIKQQHYKNTHP